MPNNKTKKTKSSTTRKNVATSSKLAAAEKNRAMEKQILARYNKRDETITIEINQERQRLENNELQRRIVIRERIVWIAISVLVIMLAVLFFALYKISHADINSDNYTSAIILVAVPVASITIITTIFLLGVFRNSRDKNGHEIDRGTLSNMATLANFAGRGGGM